MLLSHAHTLRDARSALAALSDRACWLEASSAYEYALIALDAIHGDDCPAIDTYGLPEEPEELLAIAGLAIERLKSHRVDELQVELLLVLLEDATELDAL